MEGRNKTHSLVTGNITWGMLWFAVPMILGNLLQQFYNIADTLIVGRFLGAKALAAVGSAYTLMIFLTSVLLGLCMGSGVVFSLQYGARDHEALKRSIFVSLVLIGVITLLLNIAVFVWIDPILRLLQVPAEVYILMRDYLWIIFWGIGFTFLYNYYASLLRAVGNSVLPLVFLAVAVVLNIVLDVWLVMGLHMNVQGAALAGIDVRLMLPARSDSKVVDLASHSYLDDMMKAGVKILFYKPGFLHSKLLIIDDSLTVIGSANMDFRSFEHNFEVNAFVYDREFTARMAGVFEDDASRCHALTPGEWFNRPRPRRWAESLMRVFSPLL